MTTSIHRAATAFVLLFFILAPLRASAQKKDTDSAAPPAAPSAPPAATAPKPPAAAPSSPPAATAPKPPAAAPSSPPAATAPKPPAAPSAPQADTASTQPEDTASAETDTDSATDTGTDSTPAPVVEETAAEAPTVAAMPPPSSFENEIEEDLPPPKPPISRGFVPGTQEAALGLATAGSGDYFYFGASGLYAYYVIKGLAPGLEVQYAHIFSDYDYPDSLSLMPFLKYAFTVSETVAPYLILGGGRQFEWGATPSYYQADSWFLGGGIGAHIGLGERWAIKIQVLFLHHWYDTKKVYGHPDKENFRDLYDNKYWCEDDDCPVADSAKLGPEEEDRPTWFAEGMDDEGKIIDVDCSTFSDDPEEQAACERVAYKICEDPSKCYRQTDEPGDRKREWIYPVITFGVSFVF